MPVTREVADEVPASSATGAWRRTEHPGDGSRKFATCPPASKTITCFGAKPGRAGRRKLLKELLEIREDREARSPLDASEGSAVFVVFLAAGAGLALGLESASAPPVRPAVPVFLSIVPLRSFMGVPAAPHCRNVRA